MNEAHPSGTPVPTGSSAQSAPSLADSLRQMNPFRAVNPAPSQINWDSAALPQMVFQKPLSDLSDSERDHLLQLKQSASLRDELVHQLRDMWVEGSQIYDKVCERAYDEWSAAENKEAIYEYWLLSDIDTGYDEPEFSYHENWFASRREFIQQVNYAVNPLGCTAADYFSWLEGTSQWTSELVDEADKYDGAIKPDVFKTSLEKANWKVANDESAIINHMLSYGEVEDYPLQPHMLLNGTFNERRLGLRLNGQALVIPEADAETLYRYATTYVNPKFFLGLRFDTSHPHCAESRCLDLLVVLLGNVLSSKAEDEIWHDTGFLMLLEIGKEDGEPRDFYLVCNLTYVDKNGFPRVINTRLLDGNDRRRWFCNDFPSFSVARIETRGPRGSSSSSSLSTLSSFLVLAENDAISDKIQLTPLSQEIPEIVETGNDGSWMENRPPIALYHKEDWR
ncbi:hypothetical protein F5Y10DRAFT_290396 [Nemania abortiva]|nr:hypothetical protein F5Y10DRAFT_290396 [Nemania abortiva]